VAPINAEEVAVRLAELFGLRFLPGQVELDGGTWAAVRPASPPEQNGFAIILARTPRAVTAFFHPDRFAGALVRAMATADVESKKTCISHLQAAAAAGLRISVEIDGAPAASPESILADWKAVGFECEGRIARNAGASQEQAISVAAACTGAVLSLLTLEEEHVAIEPGLPEGARIMTFVNRYERSAVNRAACIAHFGSSCRVCGFNFGSMYGALGSGYTEVHHKVPLSSIGESHLVNPVTDLVPLCANCHAMIHRRTPPLSMEELRAVIDQRRSLTG
jgi:5-methylcytosine-specific restriction enzyme A